MQARKLRQDSFPHPYYPDFPDFPLVIRQTALLVVDMQYLDANPNHGIGVSFREGGLFDMIAPYFERLGNTVIPNIVRLLECARQHRVEVIFTVIEALTRDGRDISAQHRRVHLFAPRGSREAQILDEVRPNADEIVLSKTASGVFNATAIDQILRNMAIDTLLMVGVATNGCVGTAVRDAADRGYRVVLVEDACAALSMAEHDSAIADMDNNYAWIKSTDEVVAWIASDDSGAEDLANRPASAGRAGPPTR